MLKRCISIFLIIFFANPCVFAKDLFDNIKPADPVDNSIPATEPVEVQPKKIRLTQNDVQNHYSIALDKFMQSNVRSSYSDFKVLIETIVPNDYTYIVMADKMADIGLFNLSGLALSKVKDNDIAYIMSDDIKHFYFPSAQLTKDDEIYLGEMFSNIVYNAQSKEATVELVKNIPLMEKSDYANYIAALGSFKSNNITDASRYIDTAIAKNPKNLNYRKLKAEILTQTKKPQNALKIVEYIKQQPLYSTEFTRKVNSLEQYILYKTKKNPAEKSYHLGYYYYYENDLTKSMRTLQGAVTNKKRSNKLVYALLSQVYLEMKEYEKASDAAEKARKIDGGNVMALIVLGDLEYREAHYKEALKYYQNAVANERSSSLPSIKAALTYQKLGKDKKAKEIFARVLRNYNDAYLAYYNMALIDKDREIAYLKKSIAINTNFRDGWIDLARVQIERQNYESASRYLAIAKYIDENDFRYYYYQGLVSKNTGAKDDAVFYFRRSVQLNPESPAKKELSI